MADHEADLEARWRRVRERLDQSGADSIPDEARHLLRAIAGGKDPDLSHETCREELPGYVAAEMGGLPAGQLYPQVKRHLDLCQSCDAVYRDVLELALLDEAEMLPQPQPGAPPDLSFLPQRSRRRVVQSVAERLAGMRGPAIRAALHEMAGSFFDYVDELGGAFIWSRGDEAVAGLGADDSALAEAAGQLLAATYAAIQSLISDLGREEIERQAGSGRLQESIRRRAERAAHSVGLSGNEARAFAADLARLLGDDPNDLLALAEE